MIILAHHPGGGDAQFVASLRSRLDDFWIPGLGRLPCGRIEARDAVSNLRECVLSPARVGGVLEVCSQLRVVQRAREGGHIPQQEWHQDKREGQDQDGDEPLFGDSRFRGRWNGVSGILRDRHWRSILGSRKNRALSGPENTVHRERSPRTGRRGLYKTMPI